MTSQWLPRPVLAIPPSISWILIVGEVSSTRSILKQVSRDIAESAHDRLELLDLHHY